LGGGVRRQRYGYLSCQPIIAALLEQFQPTIFLEGSLIRRKIQSPLEENREITLRIRENHLALTNYQIP
jgi:hypothetical protein